MLKNSYRRQRPIKGGREQLPACVLRSISDAVDRQARKFKCSRSFVIATALAYTFGIDDQEDYRKAPEEQPKRL